MDMNPAPDKDMTGTGRASGLSRCKFERQVPVLPIQKSPEIHGWQTDAASGIIRAFSILFPSLNRILENNSDETSVLCVNKDILPIIDDKLFLTAVMDPIFLPS